MKAYKVFKRRNGILTNSLFHPEFSQEIFPGKWNRAKLGRFFVFCSFDCAQSWMSARHKHTPNLELWEVQIPQDFEIDWEPIDRHHFEEFWNGEDDSQLIIMKRPPYQTYLATSVRPIALIATIS